MRRAAGLALLIAAAACGAPPRTPAPPALHLPQRVLIRSKGRIVSVPLEEYTLGSILAEVTPTGESPTTAARIYEVQAVVARTYAVAELGRHESEGFDLCDSTHCQLYDPTRVQTSPYAAIARQAVIHTAGRVLSYGGRAAETFFHADCGGSTAAADEVWGGAPIRYLMGSPDLIAPVRHRSWTTAISTSDLRRAFNSDPVSAVGRQLDGIDVRLRDPSGRAAQLTLRGDGTRQLTGDQFRTIVNRSLGDRTVESTKFTINRTATGYTFAGTGFGHGVGLCQLGAAARARRGDALEAILAQYFPGALLTR